jgi:hypothetical protein
MRKSVTECHTEAITSTDAQRREHVHVLARHLWNPQLRRSGPDVDNRKIVRERQCELIDSRRLVLARRELREIPAHRRRAIEDRRRVLDFFLKLDSSGRQAFAMGSDACAETAPLGQRRCGGTRCREAACLVNTSQLLGKALRPAARYGGVVVDENIRAVIDRRTFENCLDQEERFSILISSRISQFIV